MSLDGEKDVKSVLVHPVGRMALEIESVSSKEFVLGEILERKLRRVLRGSSFSKFCSRADDHFVSSELSTRVPHQDTPHLFGKIL